MAAIMAMAVMLQEGRSLSAHMMPENPREPGVTASHAVLNTTELLEIILLNLPSQDILLDQAVNKAWRDCIARSQQLQRLIFMRPADCGAVSWLDWRFDDKKLYDDIELGEPLRAARRAPRYRAHWGQTREDNGKFRVFINPMLAKRFPILSTDKVKAGPSYRMGDGMENANASWRKMLITQPPIGTLFFEWDHDADFFRGHRDRGWSVMPMFKDHGSHGITAGDLVDSMPRHTTGFVWVEGSECWEEFEGRASMKQIAKKEKETDKKEEKEKRGTH